MSRKRAIMLWIPILFLVAASVGQWMVASKLGISSAGSFVCAWMYFIGVSGCAWVSAFIGIKLSKGQDSTLEFLYGAGLGTMGLVVAALVFFAPIPKFMYERGQGATAWLALLGGPLGVGGLTLWVGFVLKRSVPWLTHYQTALAILSLALGTALGAYFFQLERRDLGSKSPLPPEV